MHFSMQRLLFLLMLVLVPLQYAWGGVSVYCEHEEGKAAQHFGHHPDHHHSDSQVAGEHNDGPGSKTFDNGHHHCVGPAMLTVDAVMPDLTVQFVVAHAAVQDFASSIAGPPERPQWLLAA